MVARAFLSVIPRFCKNSRVRDSLVLHPLQTNRFTLGFSGTTSLVSVFGVGPSGTIENGCCTEDVAILGVGSVAADVATALKRATVTFVRFLSI
jgi:hypothetical protein